MHHLSYLYSPSSIFAMPYHFSHHRKQEASHILGNQAIEAFSTRFSQYLVVLAREPAAFLAGKRDSRRHTTMSFSENVVVAETSY